MHGFHVCIKLRDPFYVISHGRSPSQCLLLPLALEVSVSFVVLVGHCAGVPMDFSFFTSQDRFDIDT